MSRLKRYEVGGLPQHIVQRGNNRQACFIRERDYQYYRECLRDASVKNDCQVHAYVLMTNHVHILATPCTPGGISHMMQSLGRKYVRYFNSRYQRTGTLFEGRYKASLIESDKYFLACSRYIEDNPVRSGIVSNPGGYRWSSYHHHAADDDDSLIKDHPTYLALGCNPSTRAEMYKKLFDGIMDAQVLQGIRNSAQKGMVLGGEHFMKEIEKILNRSIRPRVRGRPKREE